MDRDASQISPSAQGYDLDSYPGGVNFDGVPEFVEKVEAAAADESTPEPIVLVCHSSFACAGRCVVVGIPTWVIRYRSVSGIRGVHSR